ncbi:hypothetical protein EfmJHP35_08860 [Enterococcus faecium]|nr:hypothetical protein EfmJHP35_08860 [Enterococcus faecium]
MTEHRSYYAIIPAYTFAALCRIHHTEKHKIGVINFKNKRGFCWAGNEYFAVKKLNIGG